MGVDIFVLKQYIMSSEPPGESRASIGETVEQIQKVMSEHRTCPVIAYIMLSQKLSHPDAVKHYVELVYRDATSQPGWTNLLPKDVDRATFRIKEFQLWNDLNDAEVELLYKVPYDGRPDDLTTDDEALM